MPKANQDLPKPAPKLTSAHAELLVLATIAESASYGYAITRAIASRSEGDFVLPPAKLYPLLAKLEKQEFVTTAWEEVKADASNEQANGRRRKWYTIAPKGARRLDQLAEAHRRFNSIVDTFLTTDNSIGATT